MENSRVNRKTFKESPKKRKTLTPPNRGSIDYFGLDMLLPWVEALINQVKLVINITRTPSPQTIKLDACQVLPGKLTVKDNSPERISTSVLNQEMDTPQRTQPQLE